MIRFILNNKEIRTSLPGGVLLLDYIRYQQHLNGTKIGCREGDCGACTVLIGELKNDNLAYRSFTSCLTPLGNVHGKHVVTIEGINGQELSPVQQAMQNESATQCGFCTPGFVVSLTGFFLNETSTAPLNALAAIDGNICRCTGYKSIERAARQLEALRSLRQEMEPVAFAVEQQIVPVYFSGIKERLRGLSFPSDGNLIGEKKIRQFLGGGTDLYVQKPEELKEAAIDFLLDKQPLKSITREDNRCVVGPSATVTDLSESAVMQEYFPRLKNYFRLISSTPIRNMATVAGNFINASPIGDLTIFFLALDARLVLSSGEQTRELPLRQLFLDYKKLNKNPDERIEKIWFELPDKNTFFHFEKVSKRTHLDIASVNTALSIRTSAGVIYKAGIAAGGVAPIPKYLEKTSAFLEGKKISEQNFLEAIETAQTEISPISDARGTAAYKRRLLSQLMKAHFITLFPEQFFFSPNGTGNG